MQWISCIQRLKSKKNSVLFPSRKCLNCPYNFWLLQWRLWQHFSSVCCLCPEVMKKKKNSDWWSFCKILYVSFVKKERKITIWENKNSIVPTKKKLYPSYTGKYLTLCTYWYIEGTQQLFVEWKNPISFAVLFALKKRQPFSAKNKIYTILPCILGRSKKLILAS